MIYVSSRRHDYTVTAYLDSPRGAGMRDAIRILHWEEIFEQSRLPRAAYVFSDYERLSKRQVHLACRLWDQLAQVGLPLFNDPRKVLGRFALQRTLHERGWNDFRAHRLESIPDVIRFPVFVRNEREHTGSLTELLRDRADLDRAVCKLLRPRGPYRARDLLVVEFCDTVDDNGIYRKYSAFRLGDRIVARYLSHGRHWMLKSSGGFHDESTLREEEGFLRSNPHESWLFELFELAGIDYGRVDYSMANGVPRIWEINTNPMIGPTPATWKRDRQQVSAEVKRRRGDVKQLFHKAFIGWIEGLGRVDCGDVPIALDRDLIRALRRDRRVAETDRLVQRVRSRLGRILPWAQSNL